MTKTCTVLCTLCCYSHKLIQNETRTLSIEFICRTLSWLSAISLRQMNISVWKVAPSRGHKFQKHSPIWSTLSFALNKHKQTQPKQSKEDNSSNQTQYYLWLSCLTLLSSSRTSIHRLQCISYMLDVHIMFNSSINCVYIFVFILE